MPGIRKKIDRPIKNAMRTRLEHLLQQYRQIATCIDDFKHQTACDEYAQFWDDLRRDNDEIMRVISKYMVLRCNR